MTENTRIQDTLAHELKEELREAKAKWQDVLMRITQYNKNGLLTADHVSFIRDGQDNRKKVKIVTRVPASSLSTATATDSDNSQQTERATRRANGSAPSQSTSVLSAKRDKRNGSQNSSDQTASDKSEDDKSDYSSDGGDPSYVPRSQKRKRGRGRRRRSYSPASNSGGGDAPVQRPDRWTSLQQIVDSIPVGSAFPSHCPLCFTMFTQKRTLMQHLCGSSQREIACPVRLEMFPVREGPQSPVRLVIDSSPTAFAPIIAAGCASADAPVAEREEVVESAAVVDG